MLFIRVKLLGNEISALVDCGSTRTFLGSSVIELVKGLKMPLRGPTSSHGDRPDDTREGGGGSSFYYS